MPSMENGAARLSNLQLDASDQYFLHYRSLFADLARASVHAHGKLLDVGCGNKPFAEMLHNRVTEYVGCDAVQSSEQVTDVICLATELPFREASYDTVLVTQVIEHVADHQALLRETFRVLRSDGVLILSGPMYWPLHGEPYDFFRFTEHGLRFLLERTGFSRIEIANNGGKWALCGQVLVHTLLTTRLRRYKFLVGAINRVFAYLDDRSPTRDNPMNYVVVARKPPGSAPPDGSCGRLGARARVTGE
jgi:SAM-dependent methyltransferase